MGFNFNNCFASKLKLAQAYIPYQELNKIYDLEKALYFGTIFPELNMPYDIKIKESSSDANFDLNAMKAIELASPFAPLPVSYEDNYLGVYFEFKFKYR